MEPPICWLVFTIAPAIPASPGDTRWVAVLTPAIIAVPTLITGFYGQNVPYPGAEHSIGFWTSTILIVMGTVLLYRAFKKRNWL